VLIREGQLLANDTPESLLESISGKVWQKQVKRKELKQITLEDVFLYYFS
jgi:hypothetical protein